MRDEENRPGIVERAFDRWRVRLAGKLLGWAFPLALALLAALWLLRRPRVAVPLLAAGAAAYTWHRWTWPPLVAAVLVAGAVLASPRAREHLRTWARRAGYAALAVVADPLARPVPLPPPGTLEEVVLGRWENGDPLRFALWRPGRGTTHLLVAGVTGAGKGSVVWALLAGLRWAIRDGLLAVWAIDPKGGAELGGGLPLFDRFVTGGPQPGGAPWQTPIADLLDEAVVAMQARLASMRDPNRPGGPVRWHTPTVAEPAILIVVDEVASLTAEYVPPAIRHRIEGSLSLLLTQGRAAGVSVVLCTQDPRKANLAFRDLIPERVALRTAEPVADLILGPGMRERGALTDKIDRRTRRGAGVGYLVDEVTAEPRRGRFAYVSDEQLADLGEQCARQQLADADLPPLRTRSTRVPS